GLFRGGRLAGRTGLATLRTGRGRRRCLSRGSRSGTLRHEGRGWKRRGSRSRRTDLALPGTLVENHGTLPERETLVRDGRGGPRRLAPPCLSTIAREKGSIPCGPPSAFSCWRWASPCSSRSPSYTLITWAASTGCRR